MNAMEYDPGEIWDALNDDKRHARATKKLAAAAEVYLLAVNEALEAMEEVAGQDRNEEWVQELDEHRFAFLKKLSETTLHVALDVLAVEYEDE